MMNAQLILGFLATVFAGLVLVRLGRNRWRWDPAARAWTLIAVVFAIVSVVLSRSH